jgi:hypothetical protein
MAPTLMDSRRPALRQWSEAGLLTPSWVCLDKLATISRERVRRALGALSPDDCQLVATTLRCIWQDWPAVRG